MVQLTLRSLISTGQTALDTGISDLMVLDVAQGGVCLYAVTGPGGGISAYSLAEQQGARFDAASYYTPGIEAAAGGWLSTIGAGGQPTLVLGGNGGTLALCEIAGDGALTGFATDTATSPGRLEALAESTIGVLYGADGQGISTRPVSGGGNTAPPPVTDPQRDVVAMQTTVLAGSEYLVALDRAAREIVAYRADASTGALEAVSAIGAGDGLGMMEPTALASVTMSGRHFVIAASSGSDASMGAALSVAEITASGDLLAVDHVLDTLTTRFGRVTDIAVTETGGRLYITAGGGDMGLSLFTMLPDGRLLHLASQPGSLAAPLAGTTALASAAVGDELQIFAASSGGGMAQLALSLADQGLTLSAGNGGETLMGGLGEDMLAGGLGNNRLTGGGGDDVLVAGAAGADTLVGGDGADLFIPGIDENADTVADFNPLHDRLDLSAWPFLYDPAALAITTTSQGAHIEWRGLAVELIGASGGALDPELVRAAIARGFDRPPLLVTHEQIGTGLAETLSGHDGPDRIFGLAGSDLLMGGDGFDTLVGGDQDDRIFGGPGGDEVTGGKGRDLVYMGAGRDVFHDNDQGGAFGADSVYGESGDDRIEGGAGNDLFHGGADDDWIHGRRGADTVNGGAGHDTLRGGDGNDRVIGGDGRDQVWMGTGSDLFLDNAQGGANGQDTVHGGQGNDTIEGGNGNDLFYGDLHNDLILGRKGADRLFGGDGLDTLKGGDGNDTVTGGNGRDRVFMGKGEDVFNDNAQGGDLGRDNVWAGAGNDTIQGGNGNDTFRGEAGDDLIFGRKGADRLLGGGGNDTLAGGDGADTFVFNDGADLIRDFANNVDTVQITEALWGSGLTVAQMLSTHGSIVSGDAVLDFGAGDVLTIEGVTNLTMLEDDIVLI